MRKAIYVGMVAALFTSGPTAAQDPNIFVSEVMAEYPGGKEALFKYFIDNLDISEFDTAQSKLYLDLEIDTTGCARLLQVIDVKQRGKSVEYPISMQHLVQAMPKWEPGSMRGRKVKMRVLLPLTVCWK